MIEVHLFEQVVDAVQSLMADQASTLRLRSHRRGVKAWFGGEKPPREHFEAQVIPRQYVDGKDGRCLEIGFHAEHKELETNKAVIDTLKASESDWRPLLGKEAEIGVFFGADNWRRISEAWIEDDLDDPDLAFEIAARLTDYLIAFNPELQS